MISVIASILRFAFRGLMLAAFLIFVLFPTVLFIHHNRRLATEDGARKADAGAVWLANRLAGLFGIQVQVSGKPVSGPVLFASNHISWLDIPVLHSACAMGFVGKAEIDTWPVFNFIARAGGTIFHQRGCHDSAAGVTSMMEQRLQQGRAVTIFPEGGIKPGEGLRVFHARMFKPAVEVGCQVQPVMVRYMRGTERDDDFGFRVGETMLKNFIRVLSRQGVTADLHFLAPLDATGKPRRQLAEASRAAVLDIYEG